MLINTSDYTNVDEISLTEAVELIEEVITFKKITLQWIKKHNPEYL